jgi:hypothetical protein
VLKALEAKTLYRLPKGLRDNRVKAVGEDSQVYSLIDLN